MITLNVLYNHCVAWLRNRLEFQGDPLSLLPCLPSFRPGSWGWLILSAGYSRTSCCCGAGTLAVTVACSFTADLKNSYNHPILEGKMYLGSSNKNIYLKQGGLWYFSYFLDIQAHMVLAVFESCRINPICNLLTSIIYPNRTIAAVYLYGRLWKEGEIHFYLPVD